MKRKDILLLLVPSFILVALWVIFSIYHNSITSTIPQTVSVRINPINPSFDIKSIDMIKQRQTVEPLFEIGKISATPAASLGNVGEAKEATAPGKILP